ncbi:hypothetical protein ACFL0B_00025 [Thermodesulfobacteriota bacterium]
MENLNFTEWFFDRPKWQQSTAKKMLEGQEFSETDYDDLTKLCLKEVIEGLDIPSFSFSESIFGESTSGVLRLKSIGNIEGINSLAPRKPLEFGEGNISVVYGLNGSGKSGYVRILKHACGARHPGKLHNNIYSDTSPDQKCQITYEKEGATIPVEWTPAFGIIAELRSVDIFDTLCGRVYATDENEVTYEPPILSFFSELIAICEKVSQRLDDKIEKLCSIKPQLPQEYTNSELGKWYLSLTDETKSEEISANCEWTEDFEKELQAHQRRLSETAPTEKAKQVRKQKQHLDTLIKDLKSHTEKLADENCQKILDLKEISLTKKGAAEVAAQKIFSENPLEGIGTQEWKELWEKARQYSEQKAYRDIPFPNIEEEARCVLCQQSLSDDAKERFQSFESFVKGELEKEATESETKVKDAFKNLGELPTEENLKTTADAAGLAEEDIASLSSFFQTLKDRQKKLQEVKSVSELPNLPECKEWLENAETKSNSCKKEAEQYDKDGESDDRSELEKKLLELQTRKWLSQQKEAIEKEVERLLQVEILKAAKKLSSTTGLSRKKGEFAEELITDAFVARFNEEIKTLGSHNIRIELVKTRVHKGRVLHQLRLCSTSECTLDDVLSEGEYRIISLAAFFADVADKAYPSPFVFDDPISSLDQDYEEAVVKRLVKLSQNRQLIVLTHRLSLLGMLEDYTKKAGLSLKIIHLTIEPWGTGEPGDQTIESAKPKAVLNEHLPKRIRDAKAVYEAEGTAAYQPFAQSICTETRKLIERLIEFELLADVVQRHRRAINTQGKIEKLSIIDSEDCKVLDEMMTKYSRYEHSQSKEAPVTLPDPDSISEDIKKLKEWRDSFDKRKK